MKNILDSDTSEVEDSTKSKSNYSDKDKYKVCTAKEICTNLIFWCLFIMTCYVTMMFAINSARKYKQSDQFLDDAAIQEKHHTFHRKVRDRHIYDDGDTPEFIKLLSES